MRTLLLLPLLAIGCGGGDNLSTHEGIADTQIAAMNDFAEIIEGIKTKSDVDSAKPKLEKIAKRMEAADAAAKKLGEPSPEEKKRLEEKVHAAAKRLEPRMEKAMQGLQNNPEAMMALSGVIMEMAPKIAR